MLTIARLRYRFWLWLTVRVVIPVNARRIAAHKALDRRLYGG